MLLEVASLKKSFGSIIVADDLDLAIATGEAVGIIGSNGAGYTDAERRHPFTLETA